MAAPMEKTGITDTFYRTLEMRAFILLATLVAYGSARSLTLSYSMCDSEFDLGSDETIYLSYDGTGIHKSPCKVVFTNSEYNRKTCVSSVGMDLACNLKLLYNKKTYSENIPDQTFTCYLAQSKDWCTFTNSEVIVALLHDKVGSSGRSSFELQISSVKDSFASDIIETAVTTVYVIIGVVIGSIVLIVVLIVVCVCCICNRRRQNAGGTVYRSPQQAAVTTGNYPVQATNFPQGQPGYQPPPQGYQPPPQGYQPPPQGYQPPPQGYRPPPQGQQPPQPYEAGYQPPPQGYGASYPPPQPAAYPEKPAQASAPPADIQMSSMEPPPYPGT